MLRSYFLFLAPGPTATTIKLIHPQRGAARAGGVRGFLYDATILRAFRASFAPFISRYLRRRISSAHSDKSLSRVENVRCYFNVPRLNRKEAVKLSATRAESTRAVDESTFIYRAPSAVRMKRKLRGERREMAPSPIRECH